MDAFGGNAGLMAGAQWMTDGERDNLASLHSHEEVLRAQSLTLVEQRSDLKDHLDLVQDAMNVIWAFTQEHAHNSDDELTMQFFGIRLFNAAAVSIKLALSGYYQKAFVHVRDILETYFLVDYLRANPEKVAVWKSSTKKQRLTDFSPRKIREELDKRDGFKENARKFAYDLISENASHATYRGFHLTTQGGLGQIGPFVDELKLQAWLEEMAKRLGHGAVVLLADYEGVDHPLDLTRRHYLQAMNGWGQKYYGPLFPKAPNMAAPSVDAPKGK
jgi:hypothetical protein